MRISKYAALVFALALTACNGAGNAASGSNSANSAEAVGAAQKVNIDQVKQSVTTAQSALQNAQTTLGTIFNSNGSFNWDIFLGGVDFSTLGTSTQQCLANAFPTQNILALVLTAPNDIATALGCIFNDVITVGGIANTDLNTAMTTLQAGLAAATPGTPDYIAIQSMISEVQSLQTTYSTTMQSVASQLNIAVTFLNELPTMATSLIPVPILSMLGGMVVQEFVQPIVTEIITFQNQLKAL